jgi:ATP-binding cassette subfamily C (CFTR/MRP) protein 1
MNKVALGARSKPIDLDALPMPEALYSDAAHDQFEAVWTSTKKAATKEKPASLKRALLKTFGKELMLAGLFKLVWSVCVIM